MVRQSTTRRQFLVGSGTAAAASLAGCIGGSGSGNKTYIVPFSQGGGTDTYARKVIPEMSKELDTGIAIENIPGAGSLKGVGKLYKSEPNGQTFGGFNPPSTPITYLVYQPDWDITDLVPIATYARTPYAIFARPGLEIEGLKDLVSRYESGDLKKFGGLARGGIVHVAANLMSSLYGLKYDQYVGYDGAGPAIKGALSNEVPVIATTDTAARSAVEGGDLEPVTILSSQGSSVFPDAPSPSDEGFESIDYIGQLTRGMFLPPETPTEERDELKNALEAALQHDAVQEWSEKTGNAVEFGPPEKAKQAVKNSIEIIPKRVDLEEIANA